MKQLGEVIEDDELLLVAEEGISLNSERDFVGEKKFELRTTKTLKIPLESKSGPRTKSVAKKQKSQTIRKGSIIAEATLLLGES